MIENYSALPIIEVSLHIFHVAKGISANIIRQAAHKSYCICILAASFKTAWQGFVYHAK